MLKASFILGLIAGILGILSSFCVTCAGTCGSVYGSTLEQAAIVDAGPSGAAATAATDTATTGSAVAIGIGVSLLLLSIFAIVGAGLVQKYKVAGAILQLCYPVVGLILILVFGIKGGGDSAFSSGVGFLGFVLPAFLLLISSILGFGGKKATV